MSSLVNFTKYLKKIMIIHKLFKKNRIPKSLYEVSIIPDTKIKNITSEEYFKIFLVIIICKNPQQTLAN